MRRTQSPGARQQRYGNDPLRASTGSLHRTPTEQMYYGGPPMAPAPPPSGPPHGHHNRPYSGSHSPQDSAEDLHYYPSHPQSVPTTPGYGPPQPSPGGGITQWMNMGPPIPGMMGAPAPPAPHMAPAPGPPGPPQPGMRGMDPHMHNRMNSLGRRNTQNEKQPPRPTNVIHQQQHHSQPAAPHAPQNYDRSPDYDLRGPPRRGAQTSRSSSRSPSPAGRPHIVPGQSGGRPHSTAYHSSSSNFSGESYDMNFPTERQPDHRQGAYIVPNSSQPGTARDREYQLGGPPPSEFRREGTVYYPNSARPVLGEQQRSRPPRRERSRSRGPHHGLGLTDSQASGDGSDDFEEICRPGARKAASTTEKGALVRARSRSVPASDSRAMIPQSRGRPASETSESSSGSEAPEQTNQSQIRIEYGGQTIDINYNSTRGGKAPIGNITINTTSRSHTLPLNSPINQRAIAAAPSRATPPPATQAIMPPPAAEAPAPAPAPPAPAAAPAPPAPAPPAPAPGPPPPPPPAVMVPPPPAPIPYTMPHGVEPMILPPPPAPGIVPPAPGTMLPPRRSGSDGDYDDHDFRDRDLYRMESLSLRDGPESPYRDDHRGRDRDMIPAVGAPREHSRRRRSISRNRKSVDGAEPRWTKISRDIVARRAVEVIGYDFKEQSDSIIVFQVLNEAQIDELIELSGRIRNGEVRVIRRERSTTREDKEHRHHRRRSSQHRHSHKSRPNSIHGFPSPGPGPGPSANRPPPGKPALVSPPAVPPAPEPPQVEAPAPPPMRQTSSARRPQENPDQPGTYIGYTRNPPRSAQSSGPYHSRHGNGKRSG